MRAAIANAVLATLLASAPARADEPPAANLVFVELAGNCVVGSANYERTIADRVLVRVGVGLVPFGFDGAGGVVVEEVVTVGTLFGTGRHNFELALGAVAGQPSDGSRWGAFATGVFGYRHRAASGNVFRVGATPLVRLRSWSDEGWGLLVTPLFGLSFGQSW